MLEMGKIKNCIDTTLKKIFGMLLLICLDVVVGKAHLFAKRVILLPCLLISGLVFAGDVRTVSFDGDSKVWKCTQEQVILGTSTLGDKSHLADGVGKGRAEVSGSDSSLLLNGKMNTEAISGNRADESANDSKPTTDSRKFVSGEIHSLAEAWFWGAVGAAIGLIILYGLIGLWFLVRHVISNAQAQPPACRSEAEAGRSAGAPCWAALRSEADLFHERLVVPEQVFLIH